MTICNEDSDCPENNACVNNTCEYNYRNIAILGVLGVSAVLIVSVLVMTSSK